jgi:hypothetical protein
MITEKEVTRAIEECMRDPITGNKRAVLADLIIIHDYLFGNPSPKPEPVQIPMQSYSPPPIEASATEIQTIVETSGDSDFLRAVDGRKADRVWRLMDELVEAVKILHPRMYSMLIDKIQDI